MIVNDAMVDALDAICRNESGQEFCDLDVSNNELGNRLIYLYYQTASISSRELITEFMSQAGVVWLRKLLTKDTAPIASSRSEFASMSDYLDLLIANDCSVELQASFV
jgi:hypothetical protein